MQMFYDNVIFVSDQNRKYKQDKDLTNITDLTWSAPEPISAICL